MYIFTVERFEDVEGNILPNNRLVGQRFRTIGQIYAALEAEDIVKVQKRQVSGRMSILVAQYMIYGDGTYRKA